MTGTAQENQWPPAADVSHAPARSAGFLDRVAPNSGAHWGMLIGGAAGGVIFNAVSLADAATRHGYDWVSQPLGALSVGPGGTAQIVNFVLLGIGTCASAPGWRATLSGGRGALWYPRIAVAAGAALVAAGVFSARYNIAAYAGLAATIAGLALLGIRFRREPGWRGWGAGTLAAAALMVICLVTAGTLASSGPAGGPVTGPAGVFERLAWLTPAVFGVALAVRFITMRDARVTRARVSPGLSRAEPWRSARS